MSNEAITWAYGQHGIPNRDWPLVPGANAEIHRQDKPAWLYAFFALDEPDPIYVGITAGRLVYRMRNHARTQSWWHRAGFVMAFRFCCRPYAAQMEKGLIAAYPRSYNKVRPWYAPAGWGVSHGLVGWTAAEEHFSQWYVAPQVTAILREEN